MKDAKKIEKVRQAIKELADNGPEIYTGKIASVDEDNQCCDVTITEGVTVSQVRLKMAMGSDVGIYTIPKKDAYCVIAKMDGDVDYCLIQCSEVTKFHVKIDQETFEITKDGHVFDGGNNGGMVITKKAVERWNNIEKDINKLKSLLQTILSAVVNEPGNGAPSAFQAAMQAAFAQYYGNSLSLTTDNDVKNDKVKH